MNNPTRRRPFLEACPLHNNIDIDIYCFKLSSIGYDLDLWKFPALVDSRKLIQRMFHSSVITGGSFTHVHGGRRGMSMIHLNRFTSY